jgi:hypothetical protein
MIATSVVMLASESLNIKGASNNGIYQFKSQLVKRIICRVII